MIAALLWLGCAGGGTLRADGEPSPPRLPAEAGEYAPSHLRLDPASPLRVADLEEDRSCGECHEEIAAQWASSAHGRASLDNPWYRVSVEALREEVGLEASRHCAGCHDPALLLSGAMDAELSPHNPLNTLGVGCRMCHGAVEATPDGNASLTLAGGQVMAIEGDPARTALHAEQLRPAPLATAGLCASCHRGFLGPETGNPHALIGQDEPGAWRSSPYAGSRGFVLEPPREPQVCQDCHMPPEQTASGPLASHRFAGAHTALAAAVQDPAQLAATQAMLRNAAVIDLVGVRQAGQLLPPEQLPPTPGPVVLEVVLRNEGAGHNLPGGVKDTQDTWVELTLRTARGAVLGTSGLDGAEDAHRLDSAPVDADGRRDRLHRTARFWAPAWDHTIPPRQARVVRYTADLAGDLAAEDWPLEVSLRLQHRAHAQPMLDSACAASASPWGQAQQAAALAQGLPGVDACAPAPVTTLSTSQVWLGPGAPAPQGAARRPAARRWLDLAQGLALLPSEHLEQARDAVHRGREAAGADPWLGAEADWVEALIDGQQGRADRAAADVARAEAQVGPQPALSRALGRAMARVWRWEEAAAALGTLTRLAPQDTGGWRELAQALGSLGRDGAALQAAVKGLALWPRDPALLRSQALALRALEHPLAEPAEQAWLRFRGPDDLSALALACERTEPGCRQRRAPVPTLPLR